MINLGSVNNVLGALAGAYGCGGGRDEEHLNALDRTIVLDDTSFGYAWKRTGVDPCGPDGELPFGNVKDTDNAERSLLYFAARELLELPDIKHNLPNSEKIKYEAQKEYAAKKIAVLLDRSIGNDRISTHMWSYYHMWGCKTTAWGKKFPTVPLKITFRQVNDILAEAAEKAEVEEVCQAEPMEIDQNLAIKKYFYLKKTKKKGKTISFSLPSVELLYADKAAKPTLPSECVVNISDQELDVADPQEIKVDGITKSDEDAAEEGLIPIKPIPIKITPQGKASIAVPGTYKVELVCAEPEPGFALKLGEVKVVDRRGGGRVEKKEGFCDKNPNDPMCKF